MRTERLLYFLIHGILVLYLLLGVSLYEGFL
jgi:hypothetical protein